MEADRDAIKEARAAFAADVAQLKSSVAHAGHRLAELERGRRIAFAAESVRRLKARSGTAGTAGMAALADAERTLKRLRERQADDAAADAAYDGLAPGLNPDATASAGSKPRATASAPNPRRTTCSRGCARRPRIRPPQRNTSSATSLSERRNSHV